MENEQILERQILERLEKRMEYYNAMILKCDRDGRQFDKMLYMGKLYACIEIQTDIKLNRPFPDAYQSIIDEQHKIEDNNE